VGIPARKLEWEGRQWGRTSGSQSTSLYYLYYVTRSLSKIASISNFLRVRLATLYMVRENAELSAPESFSVYLRGLRPGHQNVGGHNNAQ
jgi:hypothetical protein